jgi:hypothetical protein
MHSVNSAGINLQPDFDKFEDLWHQVQRSTLRLDRAHASKLGLKLIAAAYDLLREVAGVASRILYQISHPHPQQFRSFSGPPAVCMSAPMPCAAQTHSRAVRAQRRSDYQLVSVFCGVWFLL